MFAAIGVHLKFGSDQSASGNPNDQLTVANQRLAPQSESESSIAPCAEFLAHKNGKEKMTPPDAFHRSNKVKELECSI